jgi:hypothetical protein
MISLIHPSRGRAQRAFDAAKNWITKAGQDVEYILSLDLDDPIRYLNPFGKTIINNNRSAVDAINNAAKISTGQILVVMSDDFDCPMDWAVKIIEEANGRKDWIMKTQDGTQGWIITLPVMDRTYYNRFGYIYYPEYRHMFCDTELTAVADLTSRKISSPLVFKHNHYSVTGTDRDDVSVRADKTWEQGERLFIERYKVNFGLTSPTGRITDSQYLNWLRGKI